MRWRVEYRAGGREAPFKYAGTFKTEREAKLRRAWIAGQLAAHAELPDLRWREPTLAPTLREAAKRWTESRVDVAENTRLQHRSAEWQNDGWLT